MGLGDVNAVAGSGGEGELETEFDQVTWICQNEQSHGDCGLIRKVGVSKDLEGPSTILDLRLRSLRTRG